MRTSEKILATPLFTTGPQSSFYYGTTTRSFFSDAIVYFFFNVKKAKVILDFVPNTNKKQNLSFINSNNEAGDQSEIIDRSDI